VRGSALAIGFGAIALLIDPDVTIRALSFLLALIFIPVIALRIVTLRDLLREPPAERSEAGSRIPDAELPIYTILVALFREAKVLPALLRGLTTLDYPAAKLDIKLVLEACDSETIAAAKALDLPGNVEIVVVPELEPRTKPRALNYALPLARGEYLVIYDAEDRPERDQLRKALAEFRRGPPNLACLQGRLNLYNADENWLTRQFTIEYCALFDGLLPTLDRLGLPFPLGGTSNHFRVSALKWLLAWDPYNVTEDADLGARLARSGYVCRVLDSTTHEEAPCRLLMWLKQRTRWLKGYVQTWLVHMRSPRKLLRELGPWGFASFQIMVGGTVLSALVHPWFYVLLAADAGRGVFAAQPDSLLGLPFWTMAWINLGCGYLAALGVGLLAVHRRGYRFLLRQIPLMPFYWLLVSVAAYRALWQFASAQRFKWEKTEHGVTRAAAPLT
jgi:cellulose synthase/poly-beta-1,6-N-acetylglucosamine synthase-like glycosyltransferase